MSVSKTVKNAIESMPPGQINLAEKYYGPQVSALLGILYSSLGLFLPKRLSLSLSSITMYKLNLGNIQWPMTKAWNIRYSIYMKMQKRFPNWWRRVLNR